MRNTDKELDKLMKENKDDRVFTGIFDDNNEPIFDGDKVEINYEFYIAEDREYIQRFINKDTGVYINFYDIEKYRSDFNIKKVVKE